MVREIFFWNNDNAEQLPFISILSLKYFLKKTLRWDCIFDASFIPNFHEKMIEIRNPQNPKDNSVITIIEGGTKAVLRQNSKWMFEFRISETETILNFGVTTPSKRINFVNSDFVDYVQEELLMLLTKLRQFSSLNTTFDIFYRDERFKKALISMNLKPITRLEAL